MAETLPSLEEVRARAQRHGDELGRDEFFFTAARLARRWGVSTSTVRAIPFAELPWKNLGRGLVRELRRYHPDDVEAYEARDRKKAG